MTEFVTNLLKIPVERETVEAGRGEIAILLREKGAEIPPESEPGRADGSEEKRGLKELTLAMTSSPWFAIPVFHHLWFLWFLCWLILAFAICARIADRLNWKGAPKWLVVVSPVRFLWLVPLTMLPQGLMGLTVPGFGPDTSAGILPMPHILFYYAIFFGFGALYYDCDDESGRVGNWWRATIPAALLIVFPFGLEFSTGTFGFRDDLLDPGRHRIAAVALQVIYAWMMTFGLMGMFRALLSRQSRTIRYLSDSSYWPYIAHLPLIIAAQLAVRDWPLPVFVKFTIVCAGVSALLLLVYQALVRYTRVGTLLNGRRIRPAR